jgi:hypothetical protein
MIVLPRQARDKRRGNSKTRRVFLQYILRAATAPRGKKNVAVSKVEVGDNKTGFTLTSPKITVTVSAKGLLDSAQHAGSTAPPLPLRQDLMLYWGNGKEKHFLRHLNLKIIVLPRQDRDKHRENSKKSDGVSIGGRKGPACNVDGSGGDGGSESDAYVFSPQVRKLAKGLL